MDHQKIRLDIENALKGVNKDLAQKASAGQNVVLYGSDGGLDSLDLVTFLLSLEEIIHSRTKKKIIFLSDTSFLSKSSPFKDTDSLEKYITKRLGDV